MFPDLPPEVNSPLALRLGSVTPGPGREVTVRARDQFALCNPEFTVEVEEPDVEDDLSHQWFIDRGADSPTYLGQTVFGFPGGPVSRTLRAPSTVIGALSTLVDGQRHVVEVFATDSVFGTAVGEVFRPPAGVGPDGGPIVDPAYVVNYAWLVEVVPCE